MMDARQRPITIAHLEHFVLRLAKNDLHLNGLFSQKSIVIFTVLYDVGFLSWIRCLFRPESIAITKTRLFKYIENFTTIKIENFQIKNPDIFHISAKNIDCGYSLEPPRRGSSNKYPQSMF